MEQLSKSGNWIASHYIKNNAWWSETDTQRNSRQLLIKFARTNTSYNNMTKPFLDVLHGHTKKYKKYHIIVGAGQSNCVGWVPKNESHLQDEPIVYKDRLFVYDWVDSKTLIHASSSLNNHHWHIGGVHFSPSFFIGIQLLKNLPKDEAIVILPMGYGGSSMIKEAKQSPSPLPLKWLDAHKNIKDNGIYWKGGLKLALIEILNELKRLIPQSSVDVLFWSQGESDAREIELNMYEQEFKNIVSSVNPERVVVCEIPDTFMDQGIYHVNSQEFNTMLGKIDCVDHVVRCGSHKLCNDGIHYNGKTLEKIGEESGKFVSPPPLLSNNNNQMCSMYNSNYTWDGLTNAFPSLTPKQRLIRHAFEQFEKIDTEWGRVCNEFLEIWKKT